MHVIGALVILALFAKAMGWVFWALVGVCAVGFAMKLFAEWAEERNLSPEIRAARLQEQEERRLRIRAMADEQEHQRRILAIQAEHDEEQRRRAAKSNWIGTAVRIGAPIIFGAITGHHHHHKH